jgi:alanyl-tRNA synthetase
VVVLGATSGGKGALVGLVSKDLVERGLSAAEMISQGAAVMGGGGSRDPELAQAGGPNGAAIEDALAAGRDAVGAALRDL